MAEETDQEAEARRQLEEFQRQQAAAQVAASKGQPNAIPAEAPVGNQTVDQTFTARGLQPGSAIVNPNAQPEVGVGSYIDQFGTQLGPTQDQTGYAQPSPQGTVGIQGQLNPREEQFWAANPLGAVKDPTTGHLIGLGDRPESAQATLSAYNPPLVQPSESFQPKTFHENDFIDPAIQGRLGQVRSELANSTNLMRGLSTQRPKGGISPYEAELQRYRGLQTAERTLSSELHNRAQLGLATAIENSKQEQATYHANTGAKMLAWAGSIDRQKYPVGSNERDALIAQKYGSNPDWLAAQAHNPELADQMKRLLIGHPDVADQFRQLQPYLQPGQTATIVGSGAKGAQIKVQPSAQEVLSKESQKQSGADFKSAQLSPEQFAQRTKVERGDVTGQTTDNPLGTFIGKNDGQHIRITTPFGIRQVDAATYDRMAKAVPQTQEQAQPTTTPAQQSGFPPAGTTRSIGGKTYVSDGKRFNPQ